MDCASELLRRKVRTRGRIDHLATSGWVNLFIRSGGSNMSRRATDSFSSLFSSFVTSLVLREAGGQRTPRPLEASRTFEDKGRPSLRRYRLLCLFAASMFLAGLAGGQETSGFPSFVPQDCHQFDCVNLLTNTINLNIPIRAKAGGMPADLRMAVSYYMSVSTNPLFPPAWLSESTW